MFQLTITALAAIHVLLLVYHVAILVKVIPYDSVWGGRLKNDQEMRKHQGFAIIATTAFMLLVLFKAGWVELPVPPEVFPGVFWFMAVLYLLNGLGNISSKSKLERYFFAPLALVMGALALVLALS